MGQPLQLGCLAYLAFVSTSATDVAIGHATTVTSENAVGTTNSAANGTITVARDGIYEVTLAIGGMANAVSNGDAAIAAIQKNSAALSPAATVTSTPDDSSAGGSAGGCARRFLSLVKGDVIRAVVKSATGAVTISSGSLSVRQISDATVYTQV